MKTLVYLTLAIGALAGSAQTFAQAPSGQLTRAQVRADLIRVEQAGYNPHSGDDPDYPADIQAAEAKIAAQDGDRPAANDIGGVTESGSSHGGSALRPTLPGSLYFGQ